MKKIRLLLALLILVSFVNVVNAENVEDRSENIKYDIMGNSFSQKESILIDGKTNALFKTYDNQESALNSFKRTEGQVLSDIARVYNLEELSNSNWKEYYYYFEEYFSSNNIQSMSHEDISYHYKLMANFFDIYENKEKNDLILEIYKESSLDNEIKKSILMTMLPLDSELVKDNISTSSVSGYINRSNAISYANSHATSPAGISLYYYYTTGDCTNFASQILEAGGVPQNNTGSIYSGWWHTVTIGGSSSNPQFTHTNSQSFTLVNKFIAYFGIYTSTNVHSQFASRVRAGSVIACDTQGDGDINHIGFVTAIGSYSSSLGYRDYKVAQHTYNYNKYVSEPENDWEECTLYYIIVY